MDAFCLLVCVLLLKNFFQLIFFLRFSTYLFILDVGVVLIAGEVNEQ